MRYIHILGNAKAGHFSNAGCMIAQVIVRLTQVFFQSLLTETIQKHAYNAFASNINSTSKDKSQQPLIVTSYCNKEGKQSTPFIPYSNGYHGGLTCRNILFEQAILRNPGDGMIILIPWQTTQRNSNACNPYVKWKNFAIINSVLHHEMTDNVGKVLQVPALCVANSHGSMVRDSNSLKEILECNKGMRIKFFDSVSGSSMKEIEGWNYIPSDM